MKLTYEQANELYVLLSERYGQDVDDEFVYKLAGAINLVDECAKTDDDESKIIIHVRECRVLAYMEYEHKWPNYLRDNLLKEHNNYKLDSAFHDFVTIELI